jgi:Arc/MetJ family transcription regulator
MTGKPIRQPSTRSPAACWPSPGLALLRGPALSPPADLNAVATEYDKCMKRVTVSLPDELAAQVKRAAGGERRVSSYVAAALEDYTQREDLDEVLAAWNAETPVPDEVRRQVQGELDRVGLTGQPEPDDRLAG